MEGELLGVGVSVGGGEEGEPPGCGAVGGCVLGSEVACFPEHAANVRAVREERVRAARRLTEVSEGLLAIAGPRPVRGLGSAHLHPQAEGVGGLTSVAG